MPTYASTPEDEERAKAAAQAKFFSGMQTQPAQKPQGGPLPPAPQTDDTGGVVVGAEPPTPIGPPASGGRPSPIYGGPPVPGPVISPAPGTRPPQLLGPPGSAPGPRGGPGYLGPPATSPGPVGGGGAGQLGPPVSSREQPWYRPRFRPPTTQFGTRFGMR